MRKLREFFYWRLSRMPRRLRRHRPARHRIDRPARHRIDNTMPQLGLSEADLTAIGRDNALALLSPLKAG
jgi:hypothetical protein